MVDRALLRRLCEMLAELCPEEGMSRAYATFADLDLRLIDFSGNSLNRWLSILQVANNAEKMDGLLQVVQKDCGGNAWFKNVYQAYIQAVEQQSNISSLDPKTNVSHSVRRAVKLTLDRNPREFSYEQQEELLEAISRLLTIGRVELDVMKVAPGSVVLTLELPSNKVLDLLRIFQDGALAQYGVQGISIENAELTGTDISLLKLDKQAQESESISPKIVQKNTDTANAFFERNWKYMLAKAQQTLRQYRHEVGRLDVTEYDLASEAAVQIVQAYFTLNFKHTYTFLGELEDKRLINQAIKHAMLQERIRAKRIEDGEALMSTISFVSTAAETNDEDNKKARETVFEALLNAVITEARRLLVLGLLTDEEREELAKYGDAFKRVAKFSVIEELQSLISEKQKDQK